MNKVSSAPTLLIYLNFRLVIMVQDRNLSHPKGGNERCV